MCTQQKSESCATSSSVYGDTLNPLEIPDTLLIIFSYLGLQELKLARLVSKAWSSTGWIQLISRSQFKFADEDQMHDYMTFFSQPNAPAPIQNYQLKLSDTPHRQKLFTLFCQKFDSSIRALDITTSALHLNLNLDAQRSVLDALFQLQFTKLTSLQIPKELLVFANGNWKLKKLKLTIDFKAQNWSNPFYVFLDSQRCSLQNLHITNSLLERSIGNFKIPRMETLRLLSLENWTSPLDFVSPASFPVLQELRLTKFVWFVSKTIFDTKDRNDSLKIIRVKFDPLLYESSEDIDELLVNIRNMFPKLEELEIISGNNMALMRRHIEFAKTNLVALKKLRLSPRDEMPENDCITHTIELTFPD